MKPLLALLFAVALAGCTTAQLVATENTIAQTLVTDDQEVQLGLQVHQELIKQNVQFSADPELNAYVERVATRVLAPARKERDLRWSWFVIEDRAQVNAFATPGGRIYVYTGLLAAANNEAEVAGVLGHEIGHVVNRHGAKQLVATRGLQAVIEMALGKDPNSVAALAAGLTGKGAMLALGRNEEMEADELGVRYAATAGYDPQGLVTFFTTLKTQKGDTPQVLTWLSSHPSHTERIGNLKRFIPGQGLAGSDLGADRLAAIQKRLK